MAWIPAASILALAVLVAPWWPWSRGWGWTMFAIVMISAVVLAVLTLPFLT